MQYKAFYIFPLIILAFLEYSCNNSSNDIDKNPDKQKQAGIKVPDFNADSAYFYIEKQLSFGPRVPNTPEHSACAAWLISKFKNYTDRVMVQKAQVTAYNGKKLNIQNIIACFNPASKRRILLCAHWDSRHIADQDTIDRDQPIPGANDGGSGVGVLLEIARQLSLNKPHIGIDIILFDAEDYGQPENSGYPVQDHTWCLGSQYWVKNLHVPNYTAMYGILLDMVGAKNAIFTMEKTSMYAAAPVVRKVWNIAAKIGYSNYFSFEKTKPVIDDHLYINLVTKIPTIDIIQFDYASSSHFGDFWHTHRDNLEIIDKNTLKAVGQTVLTVVFEESHISL